MSAPAREPTIVPKFLPYGRQVIEDDDIAAVVAALRGELLTTGPSIARFEEAFAKSVGAAHAVVCANGTAALHMAARALDLWVGTKVIVPTLTFLATASAPHLNGAEIVFADVDSDTGLMGPAHLKDAIARGGNVDALFNVHLNGQCGEIDEIHRIARSHGLKIVDDACHALGATYNDGKGSQERIGTNTYCDLSVFSFHPVKTIAMGEGGAVTTNDPETAERLIRARNHGMTRDAGDFVNQVDAFDGNGAANPWYYECVEPEFNWRANDIQCALGLTQLGKLERFLEARRAVVAAYDHLLTPYAPTISPIHRHASCRPGWHLYVSFIDYEACGTTRADLMRALAADGIGTQVHYFPVHRQPYYAMRYGPLVLEGADRYYARALSLPLSAAMHAEDVERVVFALVKHLKL